MSDDPLFHLRARMASLEITQNCLKELVKDYYDEVKTLRAHLRQTDELLTAAGVTRESVFMKKPDA